MGDAGRALKMENYVLYEEIAKFGTFSAIFKGRRKSTIDYVSVHRYDPSLLYQVTSSVQILHELNHTSILKFFEWYKSPQHLWVVTELASGGTLADMMDVDGPTPLDNLPSMITDVLLGLRYLHSLDIVLCDLSPSKVLLDPHGILKLYDFSFAKVKGSPHQWSHDEMIRSFDDFLKNLTSGHSIVLATKARRMCLSSLPSPFYLSPESLNSCLFTVETDLWSVGCVMYELWTGVCPFVSESIEELVCVINESTPYFYVTEQSEVLTAIRGLLMKDEMKRFNWNNLEKLLLH